MSKKENIIIWANCQGDAIKKMLNKYHGENYDVLHLLNYKIIKENLKIENDLKKADIFIYQHYSEKQNLDYNLSYIFNNILKDKCKKYCIPFLSDDSLFCYTFEDPNNINTICNDKPFGSYYFGINLIYNHIENKHNKSVDEITNLLFSNNAIPNEKIENEYNKSMTHLKNKILNSDVPELYYFLLKKYKIHRLWYNRNHPTEIFLNELIKILFAKMNLFYDDTIDNYCHFKLDDWVMPILPCVQKFHNLQFDCETCSSWYNKNIIDRTSFIKYYIEELYL